MSDICSSCCCCSVLPLWRCLPSRWPALVSTQHRRAAQRSENLGSCGASRRMRLSSECLRGSSTAFRCALRASGLPALGCLHAADGGDGDAFRRQYAVSITAKIGRLLSRLGQATMREKEKGFTRAGRRSSTSSTYFIRVVEVLDQIAYQTKCLATEGLGRAAALLAPTVRHNGRSTQGASGGATLAFNLSC